MTEPKDTTNTSSTRTAPSSIASAAEAFIVSYAAAMKLGHSLPTITTNTNNNNTNAQSSHTTTSTSSSSIATEKSRTTTKDIGTALSAHYGPKFTSYTSGYINTSGSRDAEIKSVTSYLDRLVQSGLGLRIHLDSYRIDVVSEVVTPISGSDITHHDTEPTSSTTNNTHLSGSALCYLTWSIEPANGLAGWSWENVYAFRLLPLPLPSTKSPDSDGRGSRDGKNNDQDTTQHVKVPGYWEFVLSDNELNEVMKRVPSIFSDTFDHS